MRGLINVGLRAVSWAYVLCGLFYCGPLLCMDDLERPQIKYYNTYTAIQWKPRSLSDLCKWCIVSSIGNQMLQEWTCKSCYMGGYAILHI